MKVCLEICHFESNIQAINRNRKLLWLITKASTLLLRLIEASGIISKMSIRSSRSQGFPLKTEGQKTLMFYETLPSCHLGKCMHWYGMRSMAIVIPLLTSSETISYGISIGWRMLGIIVSVKKLSLRFYGLYKRQGNNCPLWAMIFYDI